MKFYAHHVTSNGSQFRSEEVSGRGGVGYFTGVGRLLLLKQCTCFVSLPCWCSETMDGVLPELESYKLFTFSGSWEGNVEYI